MGVEIGNSRVNDDHHSYRGCAIWVDRVRGKFYPQDRQGIALGACDSIEDAVRMITEYLEVEDE